MLGKFISKQLNARKMIKKNYINSFILFGFCLNVLFLVFSSGNNEFLKLSSSILTIIGLIWFIYFYLQLLEEELKQLKQ